MAELPFFPLAIDAYLADCSHLEDAEHGRYLLILMELWRAPRQRLPNDDAWLARRFRRSVERVQTELRPLIAEFCQCDGNWITQKRLSKEHARARGVTKQRSDAAKSLWRKKKAESERISGEDTARIHSADEPTPTPTPTPTKKERSPTENGAEPPDTASIVFGQGREWLVRQSGKPDRECRAMLGRWRGQYGDAALIEALGAAQRQGAIEPIGFITKALQERTNGRQGSGANPRHAASGAPSISDGIAATFARRYLPPRG